MAEVNNFYDEVTAIETDDTNAWSDTTCAVSGLAASTKYLIIAKALFGGNVDSDNYGMRVETADDTTIESKSEARIEPTFVQNDELEPYFFVHSFTTDTSPDSVTIQTRSFDATALRIDQFSLLLIDLDDLGSANYFENIHADDSVEYGLTFADTANLSAADLGTTEEWLLLGYQRTGIGSGGRNFDIRLFAANDGASQVEMNYHAAEGEDTNELRVVGVAGRHKATSNTAAAIQALEEANAANHLNRGGYLIALKASAFADFKFDFTAGSISVTSPGETDLATITNYTPSTATNHLMVGRANCADTDGNSRTSCTARIGSLQLMVQDIFTDQTQNWDATDREMITSAGLEDLPATQETFKLTAIRHPSDADRNFEYRWLLMLNLEKADGAPPTGQPTPIRTFGVPTGAGKKNRAGGVHGGLI